MARMARVPGCLAYGKGLRHSLAFARTLHRRCVINKESTNTVASQLSLDPLQVRGVVRLLMAIDYIPSPERLALIAQRDPGWDDEDVAEAFGRSAEWSAEVRENSIAIRLKEPLPLQLEQLTDLDIGPSPAEIAHHTSMIRARTEDKGRGVDPNRVGGIRSYRWSNNAFVQNSVE
jgi:hypothetical protein